MSKVTFFIRGSDSGSRFKRPWTSRILSLLALALVLGASAPAQSGPPPGSTDPVGSPANYTILRGDDLALDPKNQDRTTPNSVQTFPDGNLDSPTIKGRRGLVAAYATTVMAAGRIFSQDNDQLINVGRPTSNPSQLGVESPSDAPPRRTT